MKEYKGNYKVKTAAAPIKAQVRVPGSKSITNRALLISALSNDKCKLKGVLFSDDSRVFIKALEDLGAELFVDEKGKCVEFLRKPEIAASKQPSSIQNKERLPEIYVGSAGTAARFLTAFLALSEGSFYIDASEQMKKRPMLPLFEALSALGSSFTYKEGYGYLPVTVNGAFSNGADLISDTAEVDSDKSTQFLSALLMMAPVIADRTSRPFKIKVLGSRAEGSYVKMTLKLMHDFGVSPTFDPQTKVFTTEPSLQYNAREYTIEPDVSAACYFYAAAAITGGEMVVTGVHPDSCQGDIKLLDVLTRMGCTMKDTPYGIKLTAPTDSPLHGITVDMQDFSDQTMTLAAIAPFCDSPTEITGIGHIRGQESDRISAIATELKRMGIRVDEGKASLKIYPGNPKPAEIETYNDHRIAMAFALTGLRADGIVIKNCECCRKTFENYFQIFDTLT